jgi:hypothetical protein
MVEPFPVFLADGIRVHNKSFPERPTPKTLVGTWIGASSRATFRLTFYEDQTATLGVLRSDLAEYFTAYESDEWRLRDFDIVAIFRPISDARADPLYVQGVAHDQELKLSFNPSGARVRSLVLLLRETTVDARLAVLEAAMKEYER